VHGTLYLVGIALTWTATRLTRARLLSVIPVAGSLLAALAIRSSSRNDGQHRPGAVALAEATDARDHSVKGPRAQGKHSRDHCG
jgi:hypothetical protein